MPRATLNLERKFSSATAASELDDLRLAEMRPHAREEVVADLHPVIVIASAYASAARSRSPKRSLVATRHRADLLRGPPARIPRDAFESIQNGHPLISATRGR